MFALLAQVDPVAADACAEGLPAVQHLACTLFGAESAAHTIEGLTYYVIAVVGALMLQVFAPDTATAVTARPFLQRWFGERSERFYFRTDFVITVFLGALIAVLIYSPSSTTQALVAGVGWAAAVSALVARTGGSPRETPSGAAPGADGAESDGD